MRRKYVKRGKTMDNNENMEKEMMEKLLAKKEQVDMDLRLIADRLSAVFKIEESGEILFSDFSSLDDNQKILALLTGKFFAARWGLINSERMRITDIGKTLARPRTTLSKEIESLRKKGLVSRDTTDGRYYIDKNRLKDIAQQITKVN
jgi:predicted DNA-binding transcriptional regulator